MAKDKERSINPAQQQRKLEKAKALKKSKAEQTNRRNEKLARRNPDRLQRQIDDLKALESSGEIKPREKTILEDLERDLRAVRKAREALGDKAPQYGGGNRPPRRDDGASESVLGKRQHNGQRIPPNRRQNENESETDEDVRRIPMPEDTPPPVPRQQRRYFGSETEASYSPHPAAPVIETKTTYSAAPQLRDLKKEATSRFVPDIVRRKQDAVKGHGALVEPEEMDRLEAQGYYGQKAPEKEADQKPAEAEDNEEVRRLAEEEARFERELAAGMKDETPEHEAQKLAPTGPAHTNRHVEIEEVEDEDG
ncbi:uncharacterized protein HMPREF1541_04618 [Cyphellophora europaea CBS 101466]|uniref:Wbp11/ELF5/Saf1 N-terminal domain-containing protein n=1 Tax=Cyphellophora europaea (strain CBS 101466) TaxID=1220924 RepID=W2RUZ6_CYPE1|nr:uncharacterized protein HMPREF1541_04618 [Cyphellophora europaea CBS 101466]ETN40341.1 hypothetical protein HMPREF1541_04618 [Cyphellophora europaea CBS 101466]